MVQSGDIGTLFGLNSDKDYNSFNTLKELTKPAINPAYTTLAGLALGLYQNHEEKKQHNRNVSANATIAGIPRPYASIMPQLIHQKPSMAGNLIGGVGTAFKTAESLNDFSSVLNIQNKIAEENEARQLAQLQEARAGSVSPEYGNAGYSDPGQFGEIAKDETLWPYLSEHGPLQPSQIEESSHLFSPWDRVPKYGDLLPKAKWEK